MHRRVSGAVNPSGQVDQDVYLKALGAVGSADVLEFGHYSATTKTALLATAHPRTHKPVVSTSQWPVMVKDNGHGDVPDARFVVSYLRLEEKGSDVNVATHLLVGVLSGDVDAAVVISNDSDLALPLRIARRRVPVGLVNPGTGYVAGALRGAPTEGVGNHWWLRLHRDDYTASQLPDPAGRYTKPRDW